MLALLLAAAVAAPADDAKPAGPKIGHMVYFKLKDSTPEGRAKLVAACDKYLADHAGVLFYSAGPISDELKNPFGDRDWDVALHLVFENKAAHDQYDAHPDHQTFIAENKDAWSKVKVFDSALKTVKTGGRAEKKPVADELTRLRDEVKRLEAEVRRKQAEAEAVRQFLEERVITATEPKKNK